MQITSAFEVPLPVDESWHVLLDVPRIASCMPGAQLTEVFGDDADGGKVAVRLGPVGLSFKGRARIVSADAAERRAQVRAEGSDTKGRGGAAADVLFHLAPTSVGTRVEIVTNLSLSGAVAQYGRSAGIVNDLANHLIGEFAANLRRKLELEGAAARGTMSAAAQDPMSVPGAPAAAEEPPPAPLQVGSLGLKLLWRALIRSIRRLFGQSG
jgi:carbon monoxide dehydrogenase subunit G